MNGGEFWILLWATIGLIIVFIGHALEKLADWMNDRFLGGSEKPHKMLELSGWCILMLGILIEVADASWTAHEIKKAENNVANLDAKTPRFLKPFDRIILERVLSEYPEKPRITIFLAADAFDAQEIGQQLFDCFSHAHFPMNPEMPVGFVSGGGGNGIFVGGTSKTADAVVVALKQFGLEATNSVETLNSNEIFIRIEKK